MMRAAPTNRLVVLLAVSGLPLLLPGFAWVSGAAYAILMTVAAVDLLRSARTFEAERHLEGPLSLDAENELTIHLRSPGEPVRVEFKESLPLHCHLIGAWPTALLEGSSWQSIQYKVRPTRRGQFQLGPAFLRYRSGWGLWRHHVLLRDLTRTIRIYPNLIAARQWELVIRQGRSIEGRKRSRLRGGGTEFESLREYQEGDSYRSINWAASARRGQLVTTLYQIDRSQPVMLLIDAGRLMTPELKGIAKLDHALNAALLVATVAAERGDQIGMMLFGGEVKAFMSPGKGRGQVMNMLNSIYAVAPEQVEPDYGRMIAWFRAKHKKRSLVILFTDMVDPEISRGLIAQLSSLATHHLVLLVCLTDPLLIAVAQQEPTTTAQVYEKATAQDVLAQRAETKARLQAQGVLVVDVPPEEFSSAVVNQYLMIKEQGKL